MTEPTGFGSALRGYRLAAGLTQEELAERAHISVRAVSDIERGVNRRPYKSTVTSLADALGLAEEECTAFVGAVRRTVAVVPPSAEHVDDVPAVDLTVSDSEVDAREQIVTQARRSPTFVPLFAAIALFLVLVGGFALYRLMTPTATRVVAPRTAESSSERGAIIRAVLQSDHVYRAARACACTALLSTVKVDPDLTKYRQEILDLRQHGEQVRTSYHSLHVTAVTVQSPSSGQVLVSKDETAEVWSHGHLAQVCSGPYRVRYHVIQMPAGWRVDDTQLITGQVCHSM